MKKIFTVILFSFLSTLSAMAYSDGDTLNDGSVIMSSTYNKYTGITDYILYNFDTGITFSLTSDEIDSYNSSFESSDDSTTSETESFELLDYVVSIESILFIMLILNLFLFGAYLFRITILGKNQRNLW